MNPLAPAHPSHKWEPSGVCTVCLSLDTEDDGKAPCVGSLAPAAPAEECRFCEGTGGLVMGSLYGGGMAWGKCQSDAPGHVHGSPKYPCLPCPGCASKSAEVRALTEENTRLTRVNANLERITKDRFMWKELAEGNGEQIFRTLEAARDREKARAEALEAALRSANRGLTYEEMWAAIAGKKGASP